MYITYLGWCWSSRIDLCDMIHNTAFAFARHFIIKNKENIIIKKYC